MRNFFKLLVLVLVTISVKAQEVNESKQDTVASNVLDLKYREDQFYFNISYNAVQNSPSGFKQFSFSPSLAVGFLRDFPITKNRHWAIAPGVGYNYNNIKQFVNLSDLAVVSSTNNDKIKTKIISHSVEVPVEIRWRNSTAESHRFWRVYSGFKMRYVLSSKFELEGLGITSTENVDNSINRWQYGAYIASGYNTWNLYFYYGLNPIFKNGSKLSDLNIGFMFYIL